MKNYYRLWRNHSNPWRFLAARLLMISGLCSWFIIPQKNYRLRFSNSNVAMYRWIDPHEKDDELDFFTAYLRPGDTMVDVGTNIGETVLTSSKAVSTSGSVFAFEPHPRTYGFLQDNLRLNGIRNVKAFNVGLGASLAKVSFSDDRRDDMNRVNYDDISGIKVEIETLDRVLIDCHSVQLLKVDVEGYERFVFLGGRETLRRTACVYFEVSESHFKRFGYTTADLLDLVLNSGFRVYRIAQSGVLSEVPNNFVPEHFENLVALRDRADFIQRSGWSVRADE